jgi:signal transduction histidine kinase
MEQGAGPGTRPALAGDRGQAWLSVLRNSGSSFMQRLKPSLQVAAIALLYGLVAWGGIELTSVSQRIATVWISNGLLVAALLVQPQGSRTWPALVAAALVANLLLNLLIGDPLLLAVGIAASNSIEVCIAAWALRGRLTSSADLMLKPVLLRFFSIALVLAPCIASLIAATAIHLTNGTPVLEVMRFWIPADALGMGLVVPLVLALRPQELLLIKRETSLAAAVPLCTVLLVTTLVFCQSSYPLLFLLQPPLVLAVFRLGFNGAALAISLIAVVAITATLNGMGPFMLQPATSITESIFTMQLLLGSLIVTTYPICAMLATQRQLIATADRTVLALSASQATIKALNERMTLAAGAARVGFFSWDFSTGTIDWDAQIYEMFHIDPSSGPPSYDAWRLRVHPLDLARAEQTLQQVVAEGHELDMEFRMVWPDGTERDVRCRGVVQRNERGEALKLLGLNIDVTQLRRLDRMKTEFVSIVSHELRTPLTSIRGAIGLLANRTVPAAKAQELLALANRNAERLATLVDDILDMDKIAAGKMRFDLQPQAIVPLLEQAMSANASYAARYQVRLQLVGELPSVLVLVDAARVLQVMANLLSNAAKFSPPGGTVEVFVVTGSHRARIAVRDYGPGIPAEFQQRIFGRFNQGDASDSRAQGGSGLGLAISKALLERMGGSIAFETGTGGTTFWIELPVADNAAAPATQSKLVALSLPP